MTIKPLCIVIIYEVSSAKLREKDNCDADFDYHWCFDQHCLCCRLFLMLITQTKDFKSMWKVCICFLCRYSSMHHCGMLHGVVRVGRVSTFIIHSVYKYWASPTWVRIKQFALCVSPHVGFSSAWKWGSNIWRLGFDGRWAAANETYFHVWARRGGRTAELS